MSLRLVAFAAFVLAAGVSVLPAGAQGARKVFICVDMEGITGVSSGEQTGGTGADYNRARKMMADDTNAAIRGAVAGGATEIVVIDSHGSGHNLQRDDLDAPARLISENFRRYGMMEGLDSTFEAVFLIGHHAKAGSPAGVLAWNAELWTGWGNFAHYLDVDTYLTHVSIYWLTRTSGSSARHYYEDGRSGAGYREEPNRVPTAVAVFPQDFRTIRTFAQRANNITRYTEFAQGGHFAFTTHPDLVAADVVEFFAALS